MNKKIFCAIFALTVSGAAIASDSMKAVPVKNALALSFGEVFPKHFYEKKYFGAAITGTTVVAAGAWTFFTAGTGAPAAAAGVSTVASWIGGAGAGSYMAGLSTLGGMFGGNAILGASILNGLSFGLVGGGAAFSTLPAIGKAAVIASVSASVLDGVALVDNPKTTNLKFRVATSVPKNLGSNEVRKLVDERERISKEGLELGSDLDQLAKLKKSIEGYRIEGSAAKLIESASRELTDRTSKLEQKREELVKDRDQLEKFIVNLAEQVNKEERRVDDLVVLGILSKNLGRSDLFESLISRVTSKYVTDAGYLNYLKSVAKIEKGELRDATKLLKESWSQNPYAIEQPLLLVNILGDQGFKKNQKEILDISKRAVKQFDSDKYATPYTLVSLHFRIGTFALRDKQYSLAETEYKAALANRTLWNKYVSSNQLDNLIELGIANALYGQGQVREARTHLDKVLGRSDDKTAKDFYCSQYAGGCV
jgi:hypothetical protein